MPASHDPIHPSTAHDPTAFNAWLDALFTGPPDAMPPDGDTPEASAAREMRILAARTDAIALPAHSWKEILMASQQPTVPMPLPAPGRREPSRIGGTANRIVSVAAILALLIAGVATAWVSRDRLGLGDDDRPTLQLAASPTSAVTCTTKTLSQEEVDRIVAEYQDQPESADAIPTGQPVPVEDALAAIETFRANQSCPNGEPGTDSLLWAFSTQTEGNVAERNLETSPAAMMEGFTQLQAKLESTSRLLVPPPASSYVVDRNDPAIKPYLFTNNGQTVALLPSRFVQFDDGSIGAPLLRAVPGGASSDKDLSSLLVSFVIFTEVDGRWLLSGGYGWLCPEDCSTAHRLIDAQIEKYRRLATVIGSPVASPEATPES